MANKYLIGILVLVLLTSSIYILYPDNVRIDVGKTYSTFKVYENDSWVLAGQEYTLMFDGTKKMRVSSRTVEHFIEGEVVKIIRTANFKDNVTVIDTYTFDGNEKDIELFPISHEINVLNGEGYILVYEVTKLEYSGETIKDILSPQEFGHNMKIEWEDGNYYSRIWGYTGRDEGKLTVKYRPDSENFIKQVRLFDPPKEEITYTRTTDTICKDGVCNLILYSGIRNVQEDGEWKRVENARSLKDKGFNIVYLENDSDFNIIVNDFNISYLDMDLEFLGNPNDFPDFCQVTDELNSKCDFKLDEKWNEFDEITGEIIEKNQLKFQYKWERKNGIVIKGDKYKFEYKTNPFGRSFKFGGNSTTIKLQEADTENLEDVSFNGYSTRDFLVMIKFNISSIPDGSTVNFSSLNLYLYDSDESGGEYDNDLNIYRIAHQTWTEGDNISSMNITWNDYKTDLDSSQIMNETFEWKELNVTAQVKSEWDSGNRSITIGLEDPDFVWDGTGIDSFGSDTFLRLAKLDLPFSSTYVSFYSKEYTNDTSLRPYLNITYTETADTTSPTYSNNVHNQTVAGQSTLFSILYNDDTALNPNGQYIFSTNNTGTWTNESAVNFTATPSWANVTKTLNSTSGISIGYRWFADDNAGNVNNTEIFTLTTTSADTCSCPGSGNNWEVDMEDYCNLTSACNLGTGNLSWIGSSGYFNCSSNLNLTSRDAPPSATTFYFSSGCEVIHLIIMIFISTTMFKKNKRFIR